MSNAKAICLIFLAGDGTIKELVERSTYLRKRLVRSEELSANNNIYFTKDYGEDVYNLDTKEVIPFPLFMMELATKGITFDVVRKYRFNVLWRRLTKL